MARKMDRYANKIEQLRTKMEQASALSKKKYQMDKEIKQLQSELLSAMGNSTEGTVDGEKAIEVVASDRRSVTIARVQEVCPELSEKLIQTSTSKKVKFV